MIAYILRCACPIISFLQCKNVTSKAQPAIKSNCRWDRRYAAGPGCITVHNLRLPFAFLNSTKDPSLTGGLVGERFRGLHGLRIRLANVGEKRAFLQTHLGWQLGTISPEAHRLAISLTMVLGKRNTAWQAHKLPASWWRDGMSDINYPGNPA